MFEELTLATYWIQVQGSQGSQGALASRLQMGILTGSHTQMLTTRWLLFMPKACAKQSLSKSMYGTIWRASLSLKILRVAQEAFTNGRESTCKWILGEARS